MPNQAVGLAQPDPGTLCVIARENGPFDDLVDENGAAIYGNTNRHQTFLWDTAETQHRLANDAYGYACPMGRTPMRITST